MKKLRAFLFRVRALLRHEQLDAEMREEMRRHLEMTAAEKIADGVPPEQARFAAQRAFGGVEQISERCRDQRTFLWVERVLQDLRFAARSLRKNIGFTTTVVVTLALGIGANARIFSVVDAVLLEPPPYEEPVRLVALKATRTLAGGTTGQRVTVPVSAADFFDWRKQAPSFEQIAAVVTFDL